MTALLHRQDRRLTPARDALDVLRDVRDRELRSAALRLFEELRGLEVDRYVMAARRLSCLYLSLVEAGMPELEGAVLTDRDLEVVALDGSFEGQNVALVDDTVIVGSTLSHLKARLLQLVGQTGSVETYAICVDEGQINEGLAEYLDVRSMVSASTKRVSEFSHDIARTLFINLVPYVGDYLMSDVAELDPSESMNVFRSHDWSVADVTSTQVTDGLTSSYSLVPRRDTALRVRTNLNALAPGFGDVVDVFKVRAYFRVHGNITLSRVVPLAMLKESTSEELRTLSSAVARRAGVEDDYLATLGNAELSVKHAAQAQFRFLQVVSATVLSEEFDRTFGDDNGRFGISSSLGDTLELNFGSALARLIRAAGSTLQHVAPTPTLAPLTHRQDLDEKPIPEDFQPMAAAVRGVIAELMPDAVPPPEPGAIIRMGQCPAGFVAHFFGFIDGRFEKAERRRMRNLRTAEDFWRAYPDVRSRSLNRGVSVRNIASLIGERSDQWALDYASFCVDVCNDAGVVVPINSWDGERQTIRREFRIGENSPLGKYPYTPLGHVRSKQADLGARLNWVTPRFHTDSAQITEREIFSNDLSDADRQALIRYADETQRLLRPHANV